MGFGKKVLPVASYSWSQTQNKEEFTYSAPSFKSPSRDIISFRRPKIRREPCVLIYLSWETPISSDSWTRLGPENSWTSCSASCSWKDNSRLFSRPRLDSEAFQGTGRFSWHCFSGPAAYSMAHCVTVITRARIREIPWKYNSTLWSYNVKDEMCSDRLLGSFPHMKCKICDLGLLPRASPSHGQTMNQTLLRNRRYRNVWFNIGIFF